MPTMCMSPPKFLIFWRPWQSSPPYSAAGRQKNDSLCCVWNLPKNFFCMYCKIILWLWRNIKEEIDVIRISKSCHYLVGKFKLKIFSKNKTKNKYLIIKLLELSADVHPETHGPPFALTCFPEFFHRQKYLAIKNLSLSYRCYMILEKNEWDIIIWSTSNT